MKNKLLIIMLCLSLVLITSGCGNTTRPTTLEDTYKVVGNYFGNEKVDRSNLSLYYLDEKNNVIVVELINNSKEKQDAFLSKANVDSNMFNLNKVRRTTLMS